MSKDKSRLDFIQDTKLCVIGGDYFTVIDADTDGQEYRYEKAETVREAIIMRWLKSAYRKAQTAMVGLSVRRDCRIHLQVLIF